MRILPFLFPILLIFLVGQAVFFSCSPAQAPVANIPYSRIDSIRSEMVALGIDTQRIDGLVNDLRPILFSSLADRELENWYVNRRAWLTKYGDPTNVHYCAELIYEDYLQKGRLSDASKVKNALSRLSIYDGDFSEAIKASLEAYELAQRADDSLEIGWNSALISSNLLISGDYQATKEYAQQAMKMGRQLGHQGIQALAYNIFGGVASYQEDYEASMKFAKKGVAIARANDLPELANRGVSTIAYNHNRQGQYDQAIEVLNENIDLLELPVSLIRMFLYFNYQNAYLGKKEFAKSAHYLEQGCEMATEMGFVFAQLQCEKNKASLFNEQQLFQEAFNASQRTQDLQQQLTGLNQSRAMQAMKTRMSVLEKDLEIEKLKQARLESEHANRQKTRGIIFGTAFLLITGLAIYFFTLSQNRAKYAEQQKQLAETKLQVLQSQMHPHFIFNALGGIQNYILKSKKIEAYNYLGKFATLLRTITKISTQVHIEVDQEVAFLQSYLEMEKLRFRDDFVYSLRVDPPLLNEGYLIPSMFIQPLVENALLHGLAGLNRQGKLVVEITHCPYREGICCTVEDNGRGREAANRITEKQDRKNNLSIATVNTAKRLDFLNRLGYEEVQSKIEDLYNNDQPAGTRVLLFLPFINKVDLVYASS